MLQGQVTLTKILRMVRVDELEIILSVIRFLGICQVSGNISGGVFNSNLMWKESGPYLNYTNGSLCGTMNQRAYTIIEFYCDEIESSEIEETGNSCYNKIKISTNLTCEKPTVSCL